MQFKTKLGLVDIPNEEILNAARTIAASELPSPEPQGQCERSRVATCSLPVSSVERLKAAWSAYAVNERKDCEWNSATAIEKCISDITAEMARATERQPEENIAMSNTAEEK